MTHRKVIYISGPISAGARYLEYDNCLHARQWAIMLMQVGAVPICPHLAYLAGMIDHVSWEEFIEGDCEIVRRCDAILMIGSWQGSAGCLEEEKAAKEAGIPVFTTMAQIRDFVKGD